MDSTLHFSEGASVLDVYGEGSERDDDDEEPEEDDDDYDEEEDLVNEEEEELEDDLTANSRQENDEKDVLSVSQQFKEQEEEKNEQADPSVLALAVAQQQYDIITGKTPSVPEEGDPTAGGEIKKKVYELVMTSKNNKSVTPLRKILSPPTSYKVPVDCSITPLDHSSSSPKNFPSISPPSEEEQINRDVSVNNGERFNNDYYSYLINNSEIEGKDEKIPSQNSGSDFKKQHPIELSAYPSSSSSVLLHSALPPSLPPPSFDVLGRKEAMKKRKTISLPTSYKAPVDRFIPHSAPKSIPSICSPEEQQIHRSVSMNNSERLANDYYSYLLNNSEIEGKEDPYPEKISSQNSTCEAKKHPTEFSASLISSPPLSSTPVLSRFDTTFPTERAISDESIMVAEEAVLLHNALPPSSSPPNTPTALVDVLSKVNDALGGKEAIQKIDENMEVAVLKAKIQMLRDTTKNLRCGYMVDIVFGDSDVPKKPSPDDLRRLKNIIAGELTLNEFIKSSEVTDITSAELFRRSNENLEMVQRQQIMSNPLFSEISSASFLFSRVQKTEMEKEEVRGFICNSTINSDNNLHMELFNLLNKTPGKKKDPCHRLYDRVSFLNRLIRHKTANSIMWTRLVNLVSNVSSQAAIVLFGDGDEQREEMISDPTYSTSMIAMNAVKDMNMGSIGVNLVFGAASDMLERNMNRVCVDIGELALYLNIPVVLLQWPQEFIITEEYKNILMRSISSFSAKMAIPSMYIIDQITFDDEEKNEDEEQQEHLELFSEGEKKASINKLYNEIRSGRGREKELVQSIFSQQQTTVPSSITENLLDTSTVYTAAASIIDYKIPVFDNIMSGLIKYLDKRKHLINAAVIKLLKKAKLNITVYCIKNKLNNVSAKCDKKINNEDASMKNLLFRSSALPVTGKKRVGRRRGGALASFKRPPPSVLSRRIKRLKHWESTSESELSDEDTDSSQIRDE